MLHRHDRRRSGSGLGFSPTPLIDLVFTLSIFYMLISRFSTTEQMPMDLPRPEASRAVTARMPDRVVINCRLVEGAEPLRRPVLYSIGPNLPEPLSTISERLAAWKRDSPGLKVLIRADRRLPYADVRAAMRVVADNGVELLNVAALIGEGN